MKWLGLALAVAGCNPFFELDQTKIWDAAVDPDAAPDGPPIDARPPPMCPTNATDVPVFRRELNEVPARNCVSYSPSEQEQTASAMCAQKVRLGPLDQEMTDQTLTPTPTLYLMWARLAPGGSRLLTFQYGYASGVLNTLVVEYQRQPDLTWLEVDTFDPSLEIPNSYRGSFTMSTPSQPPDRRALFSLYKNTNNIYTLYIYEARDTGTGWTVHTEIDPQTLGLFSFEQPHLSPDGLRLVFAGTPAPEPNTVPTYARAIYYTERDTLDSPWHMPRIMMSVPTEVQWPAVTADCSRVYFTGLGTVWFLPY